MPGLANLSTDPTTWDAIAVDRSWHRVRVVVGDEKTRGTTQPQLKLEHWGNECNWSIRSSDVAAGPGAASLGSVHVGGAADVAAVVTAAAPRRAPSDDASSAIDVVLPTRAAATALSDRLTFTVQGKALHAFYQGALPHADIDRGFARDERVVDSFALYHATRGGFDRSGAPLRYRAGKADHLYRIELTDATGATAWGTWEVIDPDGQPVELTDGTRIDLSDGRVWTFRVRLPSAWLDGATFPVTVDPDVGTTSVGASNGTDDGWVNASKCTATAASDGTLDSLSLYAEKLSGSPNWFTAVYDDSSGPNNRLAHDATGVSVTPTATWYTDTAVAGMSVTSGAQYWLGHGATTGALRWKYDSATGEMYWRSANSFLDPFASTGSGDYRASIYFTYTESGGGGFQAAWARGANSILGAGQP